MKVYLVWENEEGCECGNSYPRTLVRIYADKAVAEAEAKMLWGGRVTEEEVK